MWLQLSQQVSAEGGGVRGAVGAVPESHRDLRAGQEPDPMGTAPLAKEKGSGGGKAARIRELFSATSMIFSVSRKRLGEIHKNSLLNVFTTPFGRKFPPECISSAFC